MEALWPLLVLPLLQAVEENAAEDAVEQHPSESAPRSWETPSLPGDAGWLKLRAR
jgi:hypothetical protein